MKCSLGISNFLKVISSLSHSIVFLYFCALITEESFLISLAILWNSAFKWVYLSFSPLPLASLLFSAIFKASLDNYFAFLHFFFLGMVLITNSCTMLQISVSIVLQALSLSNLLLYKLPKLSSSVFFLFINSSFNLSLFVSTYKL